MPNPIGGRESLRLGRSKAATLQSVTSAILVSWGILYRPGAKKQGFWQGELATNNTNEKKHKKVTIKCK